ncbi:NAD-dependent epimerase/dehydratase family protein [Roseinatronobacter sp. NSM]|uniref:NAD-dependent epimerase/dehydratase family protein n=1 Tax=Roseinatronobacter sp. NSM TaxID=3457785 RepID=UPI004035B16B
MSRISENPDQPVIVFGGSGFVGSHLLERLKADGMRKLFSVDLRAPNDRLDGVHYIEQDIRDLSGLQLDAPGAVMFNLAAVHTTPGHAPWEYYDANVRGAIEVTRLARRLDAQQIVFTSSISVYGPDEAAKDETAPPNPQSDYGRSKLMAEQVHLDWQAENPARSLVIARPAVVFGQGEGGNFTRLAKLLSKGWFVYPGRRDTIKSCIYVGDLVDWMLAAAQNNAPFTLFNGAYSERYTIEQIVSVFQDVAFPKVRTLTIPAGALRVAAGLMRPLSSTGLGIHPDRIDKLMVSTNVLPGWAEARGLRSTDRLRPALQDWKERTQGRFV